MDSIPRATNIPFLTIDVSALERYSLILVFVPEPNVSVEERRLRTWLLHTLASAIKHYQAAKELVQLQDQADQRRDGGAILYVLDVPEQLENCVTALYRVCMAIKRMPPFDTATSFLSNHEESISALCSIRNQFEHMHSQIVSNETGTGPISIVFGGEGKYLVFRKLKMKTVELHGLLEGAFNVVASLFPSFDPQAPSNKSGPTKLMVTASVKVIDRSTRGE